MVFVFVLFLLCFCLLILIDMCKMVHESVRKMALPCQTVVDMEGQLEFVIATVLHMATDWPYLVL